MRYFSNIANVTNDDIINLQFYEGPNHIAAQIGTVTTIDSTNKV